MAAERGLASRARRRGAAAPRATAQRNSPCRPLRARTSTTPSRRPPRGDGHLRPHLGLESVIGGVLVVPLAVVALLAARRHVMRARRSPPGILAAAALAFAARLPTRISTRCTSRWCWRPSGCCPCRCSWPATARRACCAGSARQRCRRVCSHRTRDRRGRHGLGRRHPARGGVTARLRRGQRRQPP